MKRIAIVLAALGGILLSGAAPVTSAPGMPVHISCNGSVFTGTIIWGETIVPFRCDGTNTVDNEVVKIVPDGKTYGVDFTYSTAATPNGAVSHQGSSALASARFEFWNDPGVFLLIDPAAGGQDDWG